MDSGTLSCSLLLLQLTEHLGEFLVSPDQAHCTLLQRSHKPRRVPAPKGCAPGTEAGSLRSCREQGALSPFCRRELGAKRSPKNAEESSRGS